MADRPVDPWKHRFAALILLIAYAPTYAIPRRTIAEILRRVSTQGELWGFDLYALVSCVLVGAALFAVMVCTRLLKPRTLVILEVLLVVNWVPHTILVGFWGLMRSNSGWID